MRTSVQHARIIEVFGCGPVECMGAGYSHEDRKLSTRMQAECMGAGYGYGGQRDMDADTI